MSKAPIVLIGGAVVIGLAVVASRKTSNSSTAQTTTQPTTQPRTVQNITVAQKKKLENWATQKGIPVQQVYDTAKSLLTKEF